MKVAVMGAGAVGCWYGGLLARNGHAVTLIGRPALVDAVRSTGLQMQTRDGTFTLHDISASPSADAVRDADLVLFCVKSQDSAQAAQALRPHLRPDAVLLSLQNGVDNAERLRVLLPQPVLAAVVYVAVEMDGPALVHHHGRGELVIEDSPHSAAVADVLRAAGVPVQLSPDVRAALWSKLVLNCAYNALSALHGDPYGPLVQRPGLVELQRGVVAECVAVAAADVVALSTATLWEAVEAIARTMPTQRSSMAQDIARGRRTEVDYINGHVVRRGAALGIPTPLNADLLQRIRAIEAPST